MSTHSAPSIPLLPAHATLTGPVALSRQRRTFLVYLLCAALGALPLVFGATAGWQAAGIGLWFPGAGFFAIGGWYTLLVPVVLVLFLVALFLWFATGNVVAPVAVWGLASIVAGGLAEDVIAPWSPWMTAALVAAVGLWSRMGRGKKLAAVLERRDARNVYLPRAVAQAEARAEAAPAAGTRELTGEDLAALRFILDRALQPMDRFDGFNIIEQFQPSALRYQLNHLQYALAVVQCNYTPSFHGYLSQAQRNLIDKLALPKVWSYWRLESLWGHLSLDYDPANKDNIMLTGWSGICLNTYMLSSGDRHYSQPGSLTFSLPGGRSYAHDTHSFERSLMRNFAASPYCLFPCEPNWIYPVCNLYGLNAMAAYDRVFGTAHVEEVRADFECNLERELMRPDGAVHAFRSKWTGLAAPASDDLMNLGSIAFMAAPAMPALARRSWAIMREEKIKTDANGRIDIQLQPSAMLDAGNYKMTGAMALAYLALVAREHGDREVAEAALAKAERDLAPEYKDGVLTYTKASTMSNALLAQARFSRTGDWRRTVTEGPAASVFDGPVLADVSYPDVLVAKAYSDGAALDLILVPGVHPGSFPLKIKRLQPEGRYRLTVEGASESLVADAHGNAVVQVQLSARTALRLSPET